MFPQSQRRRYREGFSLLELVFVITLIGITCAIVLPHWSNSIQNYQLTVAARRVASDLAWAQSCANCGSTAITVSFDLVGGTYQIQGIADPDHPSQTYLVNLTADPYHATLASASFAGATTIVFNGYGVPTQGGTVVVGVGGVQRTIGVNAVTGQITIQ